MEKIDIKNMDRQSKIDFLNRIAKGEVVIHKGAAVERDGVIIIENEGRYFTDGNLTTELSTEFVENEIQGCMILPHNGR